MDDTIAAISTPIGIGGISIIRVSGDRAIELVDSIFDGKDLNKVGSHTIHYGHIVYEGILIDEVLVSVMRAPKTYTVEDVVEVNLHGGIATTNKVLSILLEIGCRLAEPGEFTKRAFLNGRIDLVKAEAVSDVIEAENEYARELSINQLSGKLSAIIRDMKERIISLESNIEVNVDYPEYEDIEEVTTAKVKDELLKLKSELEKLLMESTNGKMIKHGLDVAIVGKPNVGKSSILNALLEEDKAIVTDIAGTTRDIVEGKVVLRGIQLNFIDTAGIRDTADVVEKIGVDKSLEQIKKADLIILVLNNADELTKEEEDILKSLENKRHIVFVNKDDLDKRLKLGIDVEVVYGNTVTPNGLDALKMKIIDLFELETLPKKDFTYVSNARELALLKKVKDSIASAWEAVSRDVPVDIIAIDLKEAREYLGELLGEVYDDELIDELFSRFCLGK